MHVSDMGKKGIYAACYNYSYTVNTRISYLSHVNMFFCHNCFPQNILFYIPVIKFMRVSSTSTIVYKAIVIDQHDLL
jgi:hypothetical protein